MKPTLHHYPGSLFSEKIRALFGYLNLEWQSVIIAPIMPRPLLMPLSGGYRKTPILQIGANIYCDTEIIARKLAALADDDTLYRHGFAADRVARWADTELFRTVVALNFREAAIAAQMNQLSASDIEAFQKDRAELSDGAPIVSVAPEAAEAHFQGYLASLEDGLSQRFLFGETPSIADFSLYHCLWFVAGNPVNRGLLDPWPAVVDFLERFQAFGHGRMTEQSAEDALTEGTSCMPEVPEDASVDATLANGLVAGDAVRVQPVDYGRIPVAGELLHWSGKEITIHRHDEQAGDVIVHFPNEGFAVSAA